MSQLKDIFGKPGEGAHAPRIFGVAAVDLGLTIAGAYGLSRVTKYSFAQTTVGLLLLGVAAHRAFGVETAVDKALFGTSETQKSLSGARCPFSIGKN